MSLSFLTKETRNWGAVEVWEHTKRCAELFRADCERIDAVLVTLPNFEDEKGAAETIKLSAVNVPILVRAYPGCPGEFTVEQRRERPNSLVSRRGPVYRRSSWSVRSPRCRGNAGNAKADAARLQARL